VLADELPPGALTAPRCRRQAVAAEHLADGQVGAAVAKFAELALDPAVAPLWVLPGDPEDQLVKLADGNRWLAARPSPVGRPLVADQLTMPPQQRLGPGQERSRCRLGQDAADCGQYEPIGGLPADSADLSFQNAKLVAERQHLDAKPRGGAAADDQDLQQQADNGVGKGVEHDRGASQSQLGPEAARTLPPNELTRWGLTGHGGRPRLPHKEPRGVSAVE
jgi:hypothetical protein